MAFELHANKEDIRMVLEGELGIDQAHELWEQLVKAETLGSTFIVEASSCESADISILQLLWAVKAQAKSFVVENPSEAFICSLDRAGMRRAFRGFLHGER